MENNLLERYMEKITLVDKALYDCTLFDINQMKFQDLTRFRCALEDSHCKHLPVYSYVNAELKQRCERLTMWWKGED